ncbi:hypothetical protein BH11MYX3_BH11MYX3_05010 [soil metagenome]
MRHVQVLAISTDPSDESAKFASKYGIGFPLLADTDGAVSKQFVGVNYDDTTIPGIVIVRRDGSIVFRQVATAKDDRLSAAELLATIDRTLGTTGGGVRHGSAAFERVQVRIDGGGGVRGSDGVGVIDLAVLVPLARQLVIGPWLVTDVTSVTGVDLAFGGRIPLLHDTGAVQITTTMGWSPSGDASWNAGLRAGPWLAVTPSWAVHLDVGGMLRGLHEREAVATLGLTYLIAR